MGLESGKTAPIGCGCWAGRPETACLVHSIENVQSTAHCPFRAVELLIFLAVTACNKDKKVERLGLGLVGSTGPEGLGHQAAG